MAASIALVHSKWQHHFENLQFSTQEFYTLAEQKIKLEDIKGIKTMRITYAEGGIFSSKREYLRISRNELIFDICAAPFGKGFFISWWHGESAGAIKDVLAKIPVIGQYLVNLASLKTYYQLDTEQMFKEVVKSCVLKSIEEISASKGIRGLTEIERQESSYSKK
jgi:hypothetical protein